MSTVLISGGGAGGADGITGLFQLKVNGTDVATQGSSLESLNIVGSGNGITLSFDPGATGGTLTFQVTGAGGADGLTGLQELFVLGVPKATGGSFEGLNITTAGGGITATFAGGQTTGTLTLTVDPTGNTGTTGSTGSTGSSITGASLSDLSGAAGTPGQTLSFAVEIAGGGITGFTAGFIPTGGTGATAVSYTHLTLPTIYSV